MQTAFLELQERWYALLASDGFQDIEDVSQPDRPLLKWSGVSHNHVVESEKTSLNQWPESPFQALEQLLYHPELSAVCESICRHGNHSLSHYQIKRILEMQIQGMSCRSIGLSLDVSYVTVFRAQKKLNEWALIIEDREE